MKRVGRGLVFAMLALSILILVDVFMLAHVGGNLGLGIILLAFFAGVISYRNVVDATAGAAAAAMNVKDDIQNRYKELRH